MSSARVCVHGLVCTRIWDGCGVHGYGYGVQNPYLQYTQSQSIDGVLGSHTNSGNIAPPRIF